MKKYDIAALGELLIDFTPAGKSAAGMNLFEQNPGGAPANVLTLAARQGMKTAFIGKVGNDAHGSFLRKVLEDNGICTDGLISDSRVSTTLAFVSIDENGEREFSFCRKPGADTCLYEDELDRSILEGCTVFHLGSLSLTDEPARSASFRAIELAKNAGAIISYDPNYRAPLWENEAVAVEMMKKPLAYADIVKVSDEEALLITGEKDIFAAAEAIRAFGVKCVIITLGSDGAAYCADSMHGTVPAFKCNAVDTTGAGDAFWGAILTKLSSAGSLDAFMSGIESHMRYAAAAASICVTRRGAIPAMPQADEIAAVLNA